MISAAIPSIGTFFKFEHFFQEKVPLRSDYYSFIYLCKEHLIYSTKYYNYFHNLMLTQQFILVLLTYKR